jgi:hypothetical protein
MSSKQAPWGYMAYQIFSEGKWVFLSISLIKFFSGGGYAKSQILVMINFQTRFFMFAQY